MKKTIGIVLGLGVACAANAAVIAGYDFTYDIGDATPAASVVADGATVSDMDGVGGAAAMATHTVAGDNTGLAASGTTFGSTAGGEFRVGSQGMTGVDLAGAITDGDYAVFTITADENGTLDLTGFSIDKVITTAQIARVADEWNVCAKVNGDASAWSVADALMATSLKTTTAEGINEFESTFIDISSTSSFGTTFQSLDSVEFRIYFFGASGANYSNAMAIDQVVVEGVIPEPATLGLVAVFGGGILFIRRRLML
jgi:hypothetical protein